MSSLAYAIGFTLFGIGVLLLIPLFSPAPSEKSEETASRELRSLRVAVVSADNASEIWIVGLVNGVETGRKLYCVVNHGPYYQTRFIYARVAADRLVVEQNNRLSATH